jgi:hypothetical protein
MASLSIPHSFTNNTVASATEVNANFASVKSFAESNVVQVDGSVQAGSTAIANLAVTSGKIADGAITSVKIQDLTIVNGDIADNAITSSKILDNTIVLGDLATALQAFLVPVGTIAMWGGASAPGGWLLCNGTSTSGYTTLASIVGATTPNMTGKFPLGLTGSGVGSELRGTGGTNTIGETHLPAHAHSVGTLATVDAGSHTHSGGTGYAGTHNHTYTQTTVGQRTAFNAADSLDDMVQATVVTDTGNAGNHFHTIGADGLHGHTLTGATANKGDGTAYFQPFVAVNYIIKHD